MPVALYRAVGTAGKRGSKLRRASEISLTVPGLDLATKLRVFQRALRSRVERRDALLDIVRAVNTTLEPNKIADLIVERAATWVPAPCWAVVAVGSVRAVVGACGSRPDTRHGPGRLRHRPLGDAARRGFRHGRSAHRRAREGRRGRIGRRLSAQLPRPPRGRAHRPRPRRVLARAADGAERTCAPSASLLEPAAVALDNALLLKRAEELSVTDDLTHLYNSRYLDQVLRRETKRASRSGRPLSLLFIDLDGFKSVNDTHGHLFGSRALVEAAAVIRGSARETDVVARFGGDEFALVLPDTGGEGAFAVGERIRERLAAHVFLADDGLNMHLTGSVGVATLPDVANSAEELIQAADKAMYQVKDRGKNGILAALDPADT